MSRTKKGKKSPGDEYWTNRPGNIGGGSPGPATKKRTHRIERRQGRKRTQQESE